MPLRFREKLFSRLSILLPLQSASVPLSRYWAGAEAPPEILIPKPRVSRS